MRTSCLLIVFPCFVLMLLLPLTGLALELLYPVDGSHVSRSNYLIFKTGDASAIDGMTIEINGINSDMIDISRQEYKAAFGDFLIVQPVFDPGENIIKAVSFSQGRQVDRIQADVYYLEDFSDIPPAKYKPFVMHLPEREALCAPCHNMNPGDIELSGDSAETNACGPCHFRMLERKHVHGPAGVYECITCHNPESQPQKYVVEVQEAELCTECHMDKVDEFKENKYVHGPVEAGYCQLCHDAHASDQIAQVIAPINDLCLACHQKILSEVHVLRGVGGKTHPLEGRADPSSNTGRMMSCTSCHNPHSGNAEQLFQRGIPNRIALCQICHKK